MIHNYRYNFNKRQITIYRPNENRIIKDISFDGIHPYGESIGNKYIFDFPLMIYESPNMPLVIGGERKGHIISYIQFDNNITTKMCSICSKMLSFDSFERSIRNSHIKRYNSCNECAKKKQHIRLKNNYK